MNVSSHLSAPLLRLDKLFSSLGYCSRREVPHWVTDGRITSVSGLALRADSKVAHADIRIDGEPLDPPEGMVILMHKPCGVTCSHKDDGAGALVYELLPERFFCRNPPLASIGRLDKETSGVLLFTDDGKLLHRLSSPKHHVAKVYEATLAAPLRGDEIEIFASGTMQLEGEESPLKPAQLKILGPQKAEVTVYEGRYHQVRRMFSAVGNEVVTLQRTFFGNLSVGDLKPAEWRFLTDAELAGLLEKKDPVN
jgi:16S rRNA pseudouridine516 synthase